MLDSFFYLFNIRGVSSKFQDVGYVSAFWLTAAIFYYVRSHCESHIINKVGAEGYGYACWLERRAYYFVLLNCCPKIYRIFAEKYNLVDKSSKMAELLLKY